MQSYKKKNNCMGSSAGWGWLCIIAIELHRRGTHTKHTPEEHTPFINKFNLPSLLAKTISSSDCDFNLMGTQVRSLQTTKTNFIAALLFA
jgi:hypothetical protein